jgi:hypothetical protein
MNPVEVVTPCLEYAANYRRRIVCWHRQIGRRMAVCARQPCICTGSICLCAWILHLCGHKHRAQIQKCLCTNGVSQWPQTGKKSPHDSKPRKWKKCHAQGFPAFDTAETAAYSKHVVAHGNISNKSVCILLWSRFSLRPSVCSSPARVVRICELFIHQRFYQRWKFVIAFSINFTSQKSLSILVLLAFLAKVRKTIWTLHILF